MPRPRRPVPREVLAKVLALADRHGGLIRWDQLLAVGVTDSQARTLVRRNELVRVRRGVLGLPDAVSTPAPHEVVAAARWKSLPSGAVVSHASAALLHGLPDVDAPDAPSFLFPRDERGAVANARLGALPPDQVETRFGLPVTSAARTLVDLLRTADDELAAQVVADGALRSGVATAEVAEVLAFCAGWPGIARARDAWSHADARAESALESRHRALFRRLGLPRPEIQVTIRNGRGRVVARVDFLFREQRTVVESDGRVKYTGAPESTLWDEKKREDQIRDSGLEVVRATWVDSVDGGAHLDERIQHAFARGMRRRTS